MDEELDFLIKDEEEAIKGYDKVIEKLGDKPLGKQLKKIREEEVAHLDFLKEAKKNPEAKYVDPGEEKAKASELWKIKL